MIKTITFDLDDTLWHTSATIQYAEQVHREWLEKNIPKLASKYQAADFFELRKQLIKQQPDLIHRISDLRRKVLNHALLDLGHEPMAASRLSQAAFDVFVRARQTVFVFEGVHQCLTELAEQFTLGVITNGNANVFQTELGRYFDFAICADKIKVSKPAAEPFQAALLNAQCQHHEMLHIGDHPEHDVLGAQKLGINSLWYNPGQAEWGQTSQPPKQFSNFEDLTAIVCTFN